MAARDFDRAARLMELAVPVIRRQRQDMMMLDWLQDLPVDVVRRSPVLTVFSGYALMVSGDLDAVEPWLADAERALAAVPDGEAPPWADTEELQTLPATIAIYRASLAQARGDVAGTAEYARRALDLARPGDHLSRAVPPGSSGWLHGRRVTFRPRWIGLRRPWPVCTRVGTWSTSSAARWCSRTCGSQQADQARHAGCTSGHFRSLRDWVRP